LSVVIFGSLTVGDCGSLAFAFGSSNSRWGKKPVKSGGRWKGLSQREESWQSAQKASM
jgi:hypothetical protein